jgi:hypothetical protein
MFVLRLIIFLFVAGSLNVIALLLAHTLPALSGWHREAIGVTAGFLLLADAIFLYILFFRRGVFGDTSRYEDFEQILDETKSGDEADSDEFEEAYDRWKDRY